MTLFHNKAAARAPRYQDISLNDWLTHIPPELVRQHLGISDETLAAGAQRKFCNSLVKKMGEYLGHSCPGCVG